MSEFQALPADNTPPPPPQVSTKPPEGILTRPLLWGLSLPWIVGSVIGLVCAGWYLFWPASSGTDANELAFGQAAGSNMVQLAPATPVPVQTGGLSVPAAAVAQAAPGSSVPEDVMKMIREGRDYATANREAISRLSDTVRAQNAALAAMQKRLEELGTDNAAMSNRLTELAARQSPLHTEVKGARQPTRHSPLAGMRLESVQGGMAWVYWQGRTWAVQHGDRLGKVVVHDVDAADRTVTTSVGVLR